MAMGHHLAVGAPVSEAPGEHLSTTTDEWKIITGIVTETQLDGNDTDDNDNETTTTTVNVFTTQLDSTGEVQGNSGEEEDEDLDPEEVSFDSPRDRSDDIRCISAKLVERILSDSAMTDLAANASVCKWRYAYDVDPRRVPELLMKAVCLLDAPSGQVCGEVRYPIPVQRLSQDGVWASDTVTLTVGCALVRAPPDEELRTARPQGDVVAEYGDPNNDDDDYNTYGNNGETAANPDENESVYDA